MRATNGRLVKVATCFEDQAPSLTDLNDDELAARRTELNAEMDTLSAIANEDLTDEQIDRMEELGASLTVVRAESARRVAAAACHTDPEPESAPDPEPEADPEPEPEVAQVEALVAAAPAPRGPAPAARRSARVTETPAKLIDALPLFAKANVSGFTAGSALNMEQLSEVFVKKSLSLPKMSPRAGKFSARYELGMITKQFDPRAIATGNNAEEAFAFVTNEKNTPKGSLTASGGWCAPSETLYDFLESETAEGLYSLPEIMAARGGFSTTLGPDWADIFTDTGFCFTEGQDEAGDYDPDTGGNQPKPCFKVECPDFTETRLDVCGVCISAGYLQNRAFPELTGRTIRGALVAHQHRLASRVLADVIAGSTAIDAANLDMNPGAAAPILDAIELQVLDMRYRGRLGLGKTVELIAPLWTLGLIRADLSRRLGVDLLSVGDARIRAFFAERGVNAQFVYNFDDLTGNGFNEWPTSVRFVMYPAGTWVRASSDVIDLGVVHDSTQFAYNNFTALFTEEGWAVIKRGHDSRVVSVNVCPSGVTGAGANLVCSDESPA